MSVSTYIFTFAPPVFLYALWSFFGWRVDWISAMKTAKLAVRALLGYRTYAADFGCDCPECTGEKRVPIRYRLNQPPFRNSVD